MAKREMSSTLKNLKFMQRATQREEISKKVEEEVVVVPDGNFPDSSIPRKCVVIMEGDPPPGAMRGRMSFLSFNPSVDKLNGEAANAHQPGGSSSTSSKQGRGISNREDGSDWDGSESSKIDINGSDANEDLKRKYAEVTPEVSNSNKSHEKNQGEAPTTHGRNFHKQQKRGNLDWNVLRPPKPQNR